ncbi:hypothetical protein SAVIM338S_05522 [Streptomyces avidinii]
MVKKEETGNPDRVQLLCPGLQGVIFTRGWAGAGELSSRLGLVTEAAEASEGMDLYAYLVAQLSRAAGRTT